MSNLIHSIREAMQVSQGQLADKYNIPVKSIRNWEQGVTTPPAYVPEMMIKIAQLEAEIAKLRREHEDLKEQYAPFYPWLFGEEDEDFQALDDKGE